MGRMFKRVRIAELLRLFYFRHLFWARPQLKIDDSARFKYWGYDKIGIKIRAKT